ncbi:MULTISPECIES: hypothetical protein [unclassified Pseudomonas]|uniref:hypothetical protein n=1 Tax=unclassified Pseudomonas TaxID=196821 RepID=UPI00131ADE7F|nr:MULTISPECIES: hypothetical protein [unclassified Pseudomonas]
MMNKQSTINTAREKIAQVAKASNDSDVVKLGATARAWIACLKTENLIDDAVSKELDIELSRTLDQIVTRLGPLSGRRFDVTYH